MTAGRRHKRRTNHQQINTHRINKAKLKKSAALISTGLPPRRRLRSGQVREQPNNKAGGSTVSENFALRYSTQGVAASASADAFGKVAGECGFNDTLAFLESRAGDREHAVGEVGQDRTFTDAQINLRGHAWRERQRIAVRA